MDATLTPPRTGSDAPRPLISLTDASHHVTGNPSASAVWRWCRRGVLARDGTRIRLEHRRVGGKIFTSTAWLEAFTKALTDADTAYFAAKQRSADDTSPRAVGYDAPKRPRRPRRLKPKPKPDADRQRHVSNNLDAEGL